MESREMVTQGDTYRADACGIFFFVNINTQETWQGLWGLYTATKSTEVEVVWVVQRVNKTLDFDSFSTESLRWLL